MFTITDAWIDAHRSNRGGWTAAQLAAINEPWPPTSGWRRRAVGRQICDQARADFEQALRARQATAAASLDLFA